MSRSTGLPGENVDTDLPLGGNRKQVMCFAWPKDWYAWVDRTGLTGPDFTTGTINAGALTPLPLGDAGTILIAADSPMAGVTIQLAVVLWDLRAGAITNPIAVSTGSVLTSTVFTNSAGNYIGTAALSVNCTAASGYNVVVMSTQGFPGSPWNLHYRIF